RQIDFPEKAIGRLMTAYVLAAQFLNQPLLMRAVIALYSAFGLRRTGRDDADTEFGAHASKLRQWRLPRGFLAFAAGAHIDILPIPTHTLVNTLFPNPLPPYSS